MFFILCSVSLSPSVVTCLSLPYVRLCVGPDLLASPPRFNFRLCLPPLQPHSSILPSSHPLLPPIITPHPTPIKRPIVPQRKLAPIVAEPVIAPEPFPGELIVARAFPRVSELELQFVGVAGYYAFGFDVDGAFFFFFEFLFF